MLNKISKLICRPSSALFNKNTQRSYGVMGEEVVNKYIITRTEEDKYSLYVDAGLTVG